MLGMMLILVILNFHFVYNTWKLAGVWDVPQKLSVLNLIGDYLRTMPELTLISTWFWAAKLFNLSSTVLAYAQQCDC